MKPIYLFVYGTLKPDYPMGPYKELLEPVGRAKALGCILHSSGAYPAMKRGNGIVKGWVVKVRPEDLIHLDQYEGNGFLFNREPVDVEMLTGPPEVSNVQAYFYLNAPSSQAVVAEEWP